MTVAHSSPYGTAEGRWAGMGPYYAMFPNAFADHIINYYTEPGHTILDPFAGRGTTLFSAARYQRTAVGCDINPLGYVYAKAKLRAASCRDVTRRLTQLLQASLDTPPDADQLPEFFHRCYSRSVLDFLLTCRARLTWRTRKTDWTLMAFILVYLHGKSGQSLSNQMRQSTAMAPDYCVRWWNQKGSRPPNIDVRQFLQRRIDWRYRYGSPCVANARIYLDNSARRLPRLYSRFGGRVKLLLTSPPYHNVTDYYYDQWVRLWLLGAPEHPQRHSQRYGGKFGNRDVHLKLLTDVFGKTRPLLAHDAVIYVRTDQRPTTLSNTKDALTAAFPDRTFYGSSTPFSPVLTRSHTAAAVLPNNPTARLT